MATTLTQHSVVRVLVVDDHPGVRAGIAGLVNGEHPLLSAVGTAASAGDALEQARALRPDVVVLDVNLNGEDGVALIPALHRAAPCRVIVLSSHMDEHVAAHALHLGAHACLHKGAPATDLLSCIAGTSASRDGEHADPETQEGNSMMPDQHPATAATVFLKREDGVTAIEYGLLAALIVVACIGALSATGANLNALYNFWSAAVSAALGGAL
jgi:two-component system, NarL family, nitrate/nitrite response regulator NarL